MIFVFVVDTSPSMGKPAFPSNAAPTNTPTSGSSSVSGGGSTNNSLSRLDVAKMVVEDFHRQWRKLRQKQMQSLGGGGTLNFLGPLGQWPIASTTTSTTTTTTTFSSQQQQQQQQLPDQFLLLSTSRQHSDRTATCAGGGRLLVGYYHPQQQQQQSTEAPLPLSPAAASVDIATIAAETFHRELKQLKVATIPTNNNNDTNESAPTTTWNEEWGGAAGLNIALSTGLELISRYRLQYKHTEHFGMGRLPNTAINMILPSSNTSIVTLSSATAQSSNVPATVSQQQQQQQQQSNATAIIIGPATSALQPACLIVLTDGACLRNSEKQGGGSIQLHYGLQPLREFYQEPFRWDQRIFIQAIGVNSATMTSTQYLHPQLRSLCDVTGGAHFIVRLNHPHQHHNFNNGIQSTNEAMLRFICPSLPNVLPIPDPLYTNIIRKDNNATLQQQCSPLVLSSNSNSNPFCFMNGGPICSFQCLEMEEPNNKKSNNVYRAMMLYVGSAATTTTTVLTNDPSSLRPGTTTATTTTLSSPIYCLPESYFPGKTLDTLPPRSAQPKLFYSKYPMNLGMKSFVPLQFMQQQLYRLDQLHIAIHKLKFSQQQHPQLVPPVRLLHRDVYICEWIDTEGDNNNRSSSGKSSSVNPFSASSKGPNTTNIEYYPVLVPGAGRPSLSDAGENYLNIGILHHPASTNADVHAGGCGPYTTLTLLPPDPHILVPLLLRAAEVEHRAWKKAMERPPVGKVNPTLDEQWKSEVRAYFFRIPVYYHNSIKRALRLILPVSVHAALLQTESAELIATQCYSKVCHQKIRNGELISREQNERMERQEAMIRHSSKMGLSGSSGSNNGNTLSIDATPTSAGAYDDNYENNNIHRPQQQQNRSSYGHYDPRFSVDTYLASLRNIPAPWRLPTDMQPKNETQSRNVAIPAESKKQRRKLPCAVDVLGDLPAKGLLAFYESRRRWVFGGPGLSVRGLHAEGLPNDGSNSQHCGKTVFTNTESAQAKNSKYECLLTIGGVGASTLNQTSTHKMGEYRERLLFSRSPVVGYGSNDAAGVSATTAVDGSPTWSVDDDAMPLAFFDLKTGEFSDSAQARIRSKLMVNFGNPYKEKRANSLIPEKYLSQSPSMVKSGDFGSMTLDRPTSPPHDSFDSVEEGEAIFVLNSPSRKSPKREESESPLTPTPLPKKRPRSSSEDGTVESADSASASESSMSRKSISHSPSAPPPPPPRPPAAKRPSVKSSSTANAKQPAPPPIPPARSKHGIPPPPPLLPTSVLASAIPMKKAPPPLPPSRTQRPPPKPRKLESKVLSDLNTSKSVSSEDLPVDAPVRPAPPGHTSSAKEFTMTTEAQTEPSGSNVLIEIDVDTATMDNAVEQDNHSISPNTSAPPSLAESNTTISEQLQQLESSVVLILDNEHVKPNVELLPGWICVWSKSKQRWYFFDTKTNRSVWNWPPEERQQSEE